MSIFSNAINFLSDKVGHNFLSISLKVLGVIVGLAILNFILKKIIEKFVRRIILPSKYQSAEAERKREDTLIKIFDKTIKIIIIAIAIIMILQAVGVPVGPILAAAGIVGFAVGFGGQYLIRDIITGLFIVLENQYRIGDIICSGEICGSVENISLRMTMLRDLDGTVHYIPHGEIKTVSNLSKGYSRVNLNIGIGYSSDLEKVKNIVNKVGQDLSNDPDWKNFIKKAPQFLRVDKFADSSIEIKILGETLPAKQWEVTGELRLRIKNAFDEEDIEIPFPQRVVHQRQ